MEFSEKVIRGERILLACFLALLAPALWLESRSPFVAALRMNQPWPFWLEIDALGPEPCYALAIYQPQRRLMDVIHVLPKSGCQPTNAVVIDNLGAKHYLLDLSAEEDSLLAEIPTINSERPLARLDVPIIPLERFFKEDPLDEAETLRAWTQGLGFWRHLPALFRRQVASQSSMPLLDRLILAAELHRLNPKDLRASWLPENEDDRRTLFGHILAPPAPAFDEPGLSITTEVLNASGRQGVASQAKDVLRLQGVDVVNVGNLPDESPRTVVYDRTGRVENAQAVRDKLGCPGAQTVTEISPKKLVEVTVVLGGDCPDPGRKGGAWNSLRF